MAEETLSDPICKLCGAPLVSGDGEHDVCLACSTPGRVVSGRRLSDRTLEWPSSVASHSEGLSSAQAVVEPGAQGPPDPDSPHWSAATGILIWMLSFAAILLVPLFAVGVGFFIHTSGREGATSETDLIRWAEGTTGILVQVMATMIAHIITMAICWALVTRLGRQPFFASLGWDWRGGSLLSKSLTVVGVVAGVVALANILTYVLPQSDETIFDRMLKSSQEVRIAVAILAVGTAPLVEEVVYRGVLYSGLRKRVGVVQAVIIVTVMFAGVHFIQYWGAWASVSALIFLSFLLTMIRATSRSVLPAFIIHTLFNAVGAVGILTRTWS